MAVCRKCDKQHDWNFQSCEEAAEKRLSRERAAPRAAMIPPMRPGFRAWEDGDLRDKPESYRRPGSRFSG